MPPKNQNFKIAIYIRVSTEEQAENPEGSIRNQEDRLREAIAFRNRNSNYGEIVGVYTDAGISAKDMKRPALQRVLAAVRSGEVNLIIVTELSRLSRSTRDFIQIWDLMQTTRCRFSSLREDFDTTNAAGEMILFQLMNLAQFERRQISERVEANLQARSKRGLYNGGAIPVGYKRIPDKPGYLDIDEPMAKLVRESFLAFLREGTLSRAALWLNEQGYSLRKDKEGGGRLKRVGHFTVDNLQTMLRNKVYIGVKVFKIKDEVHEVKAVWLPIVDEVTFQRAGKLLTRNFRRHRSHKPGRLPYLLSGITCCVKCGNPMVGKSATGNGGKVGYYEHSWATKRDSTLTKKIFKCEPHRVPAKKLEPLVWQKFLSLIGDRRFVSDVILAVQKFHEANPKKKDSERLKAKLFGISSQLDALAERLSELPKSVSAQPIYKQMEKLEELKTKHQAELEKLSHSGAGVAENVINLGDFQSLTKRYREMTLNELSVDQKKLLLRRFIHKIELGIEEIKIHFIVDKTHFERELALSGQPAQSDSNFSKIYGSNTLTVGTRDRT